MVTIKASEFLVKLGQVVMSEYVRLGIIKTITLCKQNASAIKTSECTTSAVSITSATRKTARSYP